MANPVSESHKVSEIGAGQSLSQASAFASANEAQEHQDLPARFAKLRYYITQMQGMVLDTEA